MLEVFLENKAIINAIVSLNNNFEGLSLSENKWKEIRLFCDFLKPFFEFIVKMSRSEYPTLDMLLLFLDYLLNHLNANIEVGIGIDFTKIDLIENRIEKIKID